MLEYEIKRMVNNDIEYCKHEWDEYSFDVEKMAVLFDKMMFRYEKIIKNFDEDMKEVDKNPYTEVATVVTELLSRKE